MSDVRTKLTALLLAAAVMGSACARRDPHAVVIEAANPARLASWRIKVSERFTREDWREFEAALTELRQRVTADREASGSAAVEEAMCRRIHGRTFRDVLVLAYESKLARLDPLRAETKRAVDTNALLVGKPGDSATARYLEGLRDRQEDRVRKLDAEIAAAEQRLAALAAPAWAEKVAARRQERGRGDVAPALSREEARVQITDFLHQQRDAAVLKYGAWPAKFARDPGELPEPARADFLARRAAAAATGHRVIAVRLRDRWWIYDGPPALPTFSPAVLANLGDADLREFREQWANVQAEIHARKMADEHK